MVYDIVDGLDTSTGLLVKMRTTAFPASTSDDGKGEVLTRGAAPQEIVIDPDNFVADRTAGH